jgi:asparagine synthase (glutamine-hydrolysing)
MCGIAGLIGADASREPVERMVTALRHRGPDDCGVEVVELAASRVALGSTRLAIIDLSQGGHMPMRDGPTGNLIVYNGEAYNFRELRSALQALGEEFVSRTDTEAVLKAYARWGPACVTRLRGMFAFAIWDAEKRELFLARDRLGEKPLYYRAGAAFAFASEVRALLASGLVERRVDGAALDVHLFNGFLVSPLTLVRGVFSLLPGHWMRVSSTGQVLETRRYWCLPPIEAPAAPVEEVLEQARACLVDAVRLRLVSDVPLGAFLSGGVDSATLVALMARLGSENHTFSITFEEPTYDESVHSRRAADALGTRHHEVRLRRADFMGWLPDALAAIDQPTFDGLNTYSVARAAKEHGLTVALSGTGADEIFGGYPFFRTVPWLARLAPFTRLAPTRLAAWLQRMDWPPAGIAKTLELLSFAAGCATRSAATAAAYQTAQLLHPIWVRRRLRAEASASEVSWFGLPPAFVDALRADCEGAGPLERVSRLALRLFLGERCLRDADSMSMGVSLEVRTAFTDHVFLESILRIAATRRCSGAPDKPLEWRLAEPLLGAQIPRRRKQGFIFPFELWLRQADMARTMREAFHDDQLVLSVGLCPNALRQWAERFSDAHRPLPWSRLWALYVLLNWCRLHRVSL